ncbi:hypothetical protein CAPTEDRAFT_217802, partial [Capitella teleta]
MARAGYPVVVFEKERDAGGIIRNVLPSFRISAEVIQQDIDFVQSHGVQFEFGCDPKLDVLDLKHSGFDYVFLGIGAEKGNKMPFLEDKKQGDRSRLLASLQFLRQFNEAPETISLGKRVVVVGGGNTAMDSARAALKVPGVEEVRVFYRRTEDEMPADREEYGNAVKDGAHFQFLTNPESMTEDGMLTCRIMTLCEPDASGRRRPVATEETCTLPVDTIITAIGEQADSELLNKMGIPLGTDGWAAVDRHTKETGVSNVFLIGDAHTGPSTVVRCIDEARRATDTAIARNQALVHQNTEVPAADEKVIRARRGLIPMSSVPADDAEAFARQEGERCLECNHICNKCVDVCPNRANVAVEIPGFKEKYQILHLDAYCNECGNCAQFCNWESKPYKEKFTVFSLMEDFENSTNSGFFVQEDNVWLRKGREVVTPESLNEYGKLSPVQSALIDAGVIQSGYNDPALALLITDLLKRNPNPSKADITDVMSSIFLRESAYQQVYDAVDIARQRIVDPEFIASSVPSFVGDNREVGKPGGKVDAAQSIKAEPCFVEDFVAPDACVLKMLRSPHAHAYIASIDTSDAEAMPGVIAVFDHRNCPDVYYTPGGQTAPEPSPLDRRMFGEKVRHYGDRVAAVVAETEEQAEAALKTIKVDYDVLKPVLSITEAMAEDAPIVHNGVISYSVGAPDDLEEQNKTSDLRDGKIHFNFPFG